MNEQNSSVLVNGILKQIRIHNNKIIKRHEENSTRMIPILKSYTMKSKSKFCSLSEENKNIKHKKKKPHQQNSSTLTINNELIQNIQNKNTKKNFNKFTKRSPTVKVQLKNIFPLLLSKNRKSNKSNNIFTNPNYNIFTNPNYKTLNNKNTSTFAIKTKRRVKNNVLTPSKKKINKNNFFKSVFSPKINNSKLLFTNNNSINSTTLSTTTIKKIKNDNKNNLSKIKNPKNSLNKHNVLIQEYVNKNNLFLNGKIKNKQKEKANTKFLTPKNINLLSNKDQKLLNKVVNRKKRNQLLKLNISGKIHKTNTVNKCKINNNLKIDSVNKNESKIRNYQERGNKITYFSFQMPNNIKSNYIKNSKNSLRVEDNNPLLQGKSNEFIANKISFIFNKNKEMKKIFGKKEYSSDTFDEKESKMINYDLGEMTDFSEYEIHSKSKISISKEKINYNNKIYYNESKKIMLNEVEKTIEQISQEAKDYFDASKSSKKNDNNKSESYSKMDSKILCNNIDEYSKGEKKKNITNIFLNKEL